MLPGVLAALLLSASTRLPAQSGPVARCGYCGAIAVQTIDSEGGSIASVVLRLKEARRGAYGRIPDEVIVIAGVPAGRYELQVSAAGYDARSIPVQIASNDTLRLTVRLQRQLRPLDDTVASRRSTSVDVERSSGSRVTLQDVVREMDSLRVVGSGRDD